MLPREQVRVQATKRPKAKRAAAVETLDAGDRALFERLRVWRSEAAEGKPAFVVFTDATLVEIARTKPADQEQLLAVPGVGPSKWELYGTEVLDLVRS